VAVFVRYMVEREVFNILIMLALALTVDLKVTLDHINPHGLGAEQQNL
jgi:hypothetical protein